ncbi:MAG TPA: cation diffusion facilitator family transporter [Egicoccus sp.]|nr:cation diffusion facilitator family transporter [Egicoccus sp.]HSK24111.1 cation diffusion facilitator family transporter [Egicoccus sp.]
MGDGHDHGSAAAARHAGAAYTRRLAAALALVGGFFVVELVGGLLTNSLALLSDAGHMFTDVVGIGMALAAIQVARSGSQDPQRSFGLYRLEILAALANALLLGAVAVYIVFEAVQRLLDPPEVLALPMLVVGALGLLVNVVAFRLLRAGARESVNVEGAYLEVFADLLASIGVVISALVTLTTGFQRADPLFALAIGFFVLPRAWRLGRKALHILLQSAPTHLDMDVVRGDLLDLVGVASVHDLHVWTLTSGMEVGSVHLRLAPGSDGHAVLDGARRLLRDRHGIEHATVQIEPADHAACDDCERTTW